MYCTNCGQQNVDTSKFCAGCGTALQKSLAPAQATAEKIPAQEIREAATLSNQHPIEKGYKPKSTMLIRDAGWFKAIGYGIGACLVVVFIGGFFNITGDWLYWVALGLGVLVTIGSAQQWSAACPYCHNKLSLALKPEKTKCSKCEHYSQIEVKNKLLIPLDVLPMPTQMASAPAGSQSSGWGKAAAAGIAGLALGTIVGEAAGEEVAQDVNVEDIDITDI